MAMPAITLAISSAVRRRSASLDLGPRCLASGLEDDSFTPLQRTVSDSYPATAPAYHDTRPFVSDPALPDEDLQLPPPRFKILPREEEGREELPGYSCTLHKEGLLSYKRELQNPFERADKRRWKKVYLILHGTMLSIHKPRKSKINVKDVKSDADGTAGWQAGAVLKSYTLQHGEVGLAGDYKKKRFVIRIRAEAEQFLVSCDSLERCLPWLEALSSAIDVSLSLEERTLPKYQTIPRRRRRRRNRHLQILQEQENIINSHYPQLGEHHDDDAPEPSEVQILEELPGPLEEGSSSVDNNAEDAEQAAMLRTQTEPFTTSTCEISSLRNFLTRVQTAPMLTSAHLADDDQETDRKWAPPQTVTNETQLRYARRCMAVLMDNAPRRSEYIVADGRRWKLRQDSKEMILEHQDGNVEEVKCFAHVQNGHKKKSRKFLWCFRSEKEDKGKMKGKEVAEERAGTSLSNKVVRLPHYDELLARDRAGMGCQDYLAVQAF